MDSLPPLAALTSQCGLTFVEAAVLTEYARRCVDAGTWSAEESVCCASLRDLATALHIPYPEIREAHHGLAARGLCAPLDYRAEPSQPQLIACRFAGAAAAVARFQRAETELLAAGSVARGVQRADPGDDLDDPFAA